MIAILRNMVGTVALVVAFLFGNAVASAEPLVSAAWVQGYLGHANLVMLDVRSEKAFHAGHVEGSIHSAYPGNWRTFDPVAGSKLPRRAKFDLLMADLGIKRLSHVAIIADTQRPGGAAKAAEVYFTLKYFGHSRVSIVNGGIRAIAARRLPLKSGASKVKTSLDIYSSRPNKLLLATFENVFKSLATSQLIDARRNDEFVGMRKVRYVARPGSIPGSLNLPFDQIIGADGEFLGEDAMSDLFSAIGAKKNGRTIIFGNSSREAALVWFAAYEVAGYRKTQLYVGGVAEWAANIAAPMVGRIELSKDRGLVPAAGRISNLMVRVARAG